MNVALAHFEFSDVWLMVLLLEVSLKLPNIAHRNKIKGTLLDIQSPNRLSSIGPRCQQIDTKFGLENIRSWGMQI